MNADWKAKRIDAEGVFTPARLAALQKAHPEVETLGDLAKLTDLDLIRIPNFGRKTINDVHEFLLSEEHWANAPSDEEAAAMRAGFPADIWAAVAAIYAADMFPSREVVAKALLAERERCAAIADDDWERAGPFIADKIRQPPTS